MKNQAKGWPTGLMTLSRFHRTPAFVVGLFFAELATIAAPVIFGFASTPPSRGHSPSQNTAAIGPEFKYETVSIKLLKSKATPQSIGVIADMEPDGIHVRAVTLASLIQVAYSAIDRNSMGFLFGLRRNQIIGTPDWAITDQYAIDGRIEPFVADELGKLSPSQQELARAQMLQAMLADRFKLKAHPENREGPVYYLVIAKNRPKMKQATPGETYPGSGFGGRPYQAGSVAMAPSEPGSTKRLG
ncbi:MAG: TIGR03435 family protein, partial [Candidatus Acidiferrales bacterium]